MALIEDLLALLPGDAPLRHVFVGVHWTVVCSRGCGLAATVTGDGPHGGDGIRNAGRLHEQSARALAEYARSDNPLEASIGVAAINSLLPPVDERRVVEINAAAVLAERGQGKKVALVGHFPFVDRLRPAVGQLWVLEQRPQPGDYPAEAASELIAQADVVAITGTALINGTLGGLLALCRPGALVMILGPSTPLSPVLFQHGASIISGVQVVDEEAVLRAAGQGATFRQMEGVRLLTLST